MKTCTRCDRQRRRTSFSKRARSPDGLHPWCKDCVSSYKKERLTPERSKRQTAANKKNRRALAEKVNALKESTPCADCGELHSYWRMQFDHVDDNKVSDVSRLVSNGSVKKVMEEIAKCELVCGHCHMDRTHRRRHIGA